MTPEKINTRNLCNTLLPAILIKFDHIGIQVQRLDASLQWYKAVFNARQNWTLTEFSALTLRRLPGIRVLTEVQSDDIKLHLFERTQISPGCDHITKFQHVAISVATVERLAELQRLAHTANEALNLTGDVSELVWDASGVGSLYFADPEGNEFEITHYRNRQ